MSEPFGVAGLGVRIILAGEEYMIKIIEFDAPLSGVGVFIVSPFNLTSEVGDDGGLGFRVYTF